MEKCIYDLVYAKDSTEYIKKKGQIYKEKYIIAT